jgi:uncharacterized membrane protein
LYIFIFSLITEAPFNAVLSRYLSDVIYEETYDDILPCYYIGLLMNLGLSCLIGIPFCIWEFVVGKVSLLFVFTGFCGYVVVVIVFYSMLYLSICKNYSKITWFFVIGMSTTVLSSIVMVYLLRMSVTYSMLLAIVLGFLLIACLEWAQIRSYFRTSSKSIKPYWFTCANTGSWL